jgi:hypothetical protein
MARRKVGVSISFFAFQDIITAVVGIFILVILLMVLELVERVEMAGIQETRIDSTEIDVEISIATKSLQDTERALRDLLDAEQQLIGVNQFNIDQLSADLKAELAEKEQLASKLAEALTDQKNELSLGKREIMALEQEIELLAERVELHDALRESLVAWGDKINQLSASQDRIFRDRLPNGRFIVALELDGKKVLLKDTFAEKLYEWKGQDRLDQMRVWLGANAADRLGGVGIHIRQGEQPPVIIDMSTRGSAAESGQVAVGDRIIAIDPRGGRDLRPTASMTTDSFLNLARGAAGSAVTFEIRPKDDLQSKVITLRRRAIERQILVRIKPGGTPDFDELHGQLRNGSHSFGYTVVSADDQIIFEFESD